MEGSEVPKQPESTSQSPESKELQLKAEELAKATREQGMGNLYGKFPRLFLQGLGRGSNAGELTGAGAFIQGEEGGALIRLKIPSSMMERRGYDSRQVWVINSYIPPMEMREERQPQKTPRKVRYLGGLINKTRIEKKLVTVRKPTDTPLTYNGKHGEADWIQYDYFMPAYNDLDSRPGIYVNMSIAVPPEIARQIDEQVTSNPYFPNEFFKALYPSFVGEDISQNIKRKPSTEIEIVDSRQGSLKQEVRKYPQQIPY